MPTVPMPQAQPQRVDPMDFSDKYNTQLSPEDEAKFQAWAKANGKEGDTYDYDLRGFWKEGAKFADNGHGADKWKKPNHPTFSDQSIYDGVDGYKGGRWGKKNGKDTYTPSSKNMWDLMELVDYFKKVEPDVQLVLPQDVLYGGGK